MRGGLGLTAASNQTPPLLCTGAAGLCVHNRHPRPRMVSGANAHAELVNRIAAYVDKAKHARVKDAVAAGEKHLTALLTPTTIDLLQHCPPSEQCRVSTMMMMLWSDHYNMHLWRTAVVHAQPGSLVQTRLGSVDAAHASLGLPLLTFVPIAQTCGQSCMRRVPHPRKRLRACSRSSWRGWTCPRQKHGRPASSCKRRARPSWRHSCRCGSCRVACTRWLY